MMRSMFSGVSGLRTHQTRMDVIGNNIANVNTVAFKSGRVTFQEVFSQTVKGATAPNDETGRGGQNPMQIGLGVGVGSIDTIMTGGSPQRTDNLTDIAIDGEGFFIVQGGRNDTYRFTRAGNFGLDKLGNLVTASGMNVMGWQNYEVNADGSYEFNTEDPLEPINIYTGKRMIAAKATSNAAFEGNLNVGLSSLGAAAGASNVQVTVPLTVYDSLGTAHKVGIQFWKISSADTGTGVETAWKWAVDTGAASMSTASGILMFDENGRVLASSLTGLDVTFTPATSSGTTSFDVTLDFSNLTMYASDNSVQTSYVDGYTTGELVTFNVGGDGILTGVYSNGKQQPLAMLALASFSNPAGLQKVGENMFLPTTNSGDFEKAVKAGSGGTGMLNPGSLEMSNVDLSREFTEMIVTQRGFQANSRIITTSDEMLQELVNLKR